MKNTLKLLCGFICVVIALIGTYNLVEMYLTGKAFSSAEYLFMLILFASIAGVLKDNGSDNSEKSAMSKVSEQ